MQSKTWFAAVGILVVVCGLATAWAIAQDAKQTSATNLPTFQGKVLVISLTNSTYGSVLENVEMRKIGDKRFLVGKGLDSGHPTNWYKGRTVWVALDDIGMMAEFPDVETYRETVDDLDR
ncbi:MAG TPA: hypothetical protein VJL29_03205 [Thermoguttaceae bacterium]|nr:hypothetical protein [Thermoguttaceae bacterium]